MEKNLISPDWNCMDYGKAFGKLPACEKCQFRDYCRSSFDTDRQQHVEYTAKDQFADIELISDQEKTHNISGQLIAELLKLADFNLVRFYVIVCRLGNLSYQEIGDLIGVSDVQVMNYCESLPPKVKRYLKNKSLTMIEIEEVFKKRKPQGHEQQSLFGRTAKRKIGDVFGK